MTTEEYFKKQLDRHIKNLARESVREVPKKELNDIQQKIYHYDSAVEAISFVNSVVYCSECRFCGDEDFCPMLSLRQYTDAMDYCSMGVKL